MYVLAIETSWEKGSISLINAEEEVLDTHHLQDRHTHGRNLAPAVVQLFKANSISAGDVDLICVDIGPGSYTGLRVGVSFCKTLAYAEDIPVTTVVSCDAVAEEAPVNHEKLCVIIDAQWKEFYAGFYRVENGSWVRTSDIQTKSPEPLNETLDERTLLLGNGIPNFQEMIDRCEADFGTEKYWYPRADIIGQLGTEAFDNGESADLFSLQPMYLRPTQADVDRN